MKQKTNLFDRFVSFFSPQAELKRTKARAQTNLIRNLARKYEGAAQSRRTEGWLTNSSDANAEIRSGLITLRNRSRDLVRNNAWGERAMSVLENNVIGKGIVVQFYSKNKNQAEIINRTWQGWVDSTDCDWLGNMNFAMMQRLIFRTIAESGEALAKVHFGKKIPLQLEILEPDFINPSVMITANQGNYVVDGIEFDKDGKIVAYHLFTKHPGSNDSKWFYKNNADTIRVESRFLLRGFKINRAGQMRGVPFLAPVMLNLRDFDEYMDAQIVKQKISACLTAFITDPQGAEGMTEEEIEIASKIEPGAINILGQGQSVETVSPPSIDGFGEFTATILRSIASGLGLSYEALTTDLSQVNFSSARMGWLEMARNVDVLREQMLIPMIFEPICKNFLMAFKLQGAFKVPDDLTWSYTPPRREMIDPTREVPALIEGIRGGLFTLNDVIKQYGTDPSIHLQEIADMNQKLDDLEIVLDSDPRQTSGAGDSRKTFSQNSQNIT